MFDHPAHFCFYNCAIVAEKLTHSTSLISQEYTTDPSVYHKHNIYPLFLFQIQTLLLKMLFHCDSFFFYSNTIFIDVFKCNKYKKPIIQCFFTFAFRLLLDVYIKLLKQVEKHFKVLFLCNHKHSKLTYDCQLYRILFRI